MLLGSRSPQGAVRHRAAVSIHVTPNGVWFQFFQNVASRFIHSMEKILAHVSFFDL